MSIGERERLYQAGTQTYEPAPTTRPTAQLQSVRPRSVHFNQTEPDLQRLTLGQSEERIKLGKFNGKSDVGEFITDSLDIDITGGLTVRLASNWGWP